MGICAALSENGFLFNLSQNHYPLFKIIVDKFFNELDLRLFSKRYITDGESLKKNLFDMMVAYGDTELLKRVLTYVPGKIMDGDLNIPEKSNKALNDLKKLRDLRVGFKIAEETNLGNFLERVIKAYQSGYLGAFQHVCDTLNRTIGIKSQSLEKSKGSDESIEKYKQLLNIFKFLLEHDRNSLRTEREALNQKWVAILGSADKVPGPLYALEISEYHQWPSHPLSFQAFREKISNDMLLKLAKNKYTIFKALVEGFLPHAKMNFFSQRSQVEPQNNLIDIILSKRDYPFLKAILEQVPGRIENDVFDFSNPSVQEETLNQVLNDCKRLVKIRLDFFETMKCSPEAILEKLEDVIRQGYAGAHVDCIVYLEHTVTSFDQDQENEKAKLLEILLEIYLLSSEHPDRQLWLLRALKLSETLKNADKEVASIFELGYNRARSTNRQLPHPLPHSEPTIKYTPPEPLKRPVPDLRGFR